MIKRETIFGRNVSVYSARPSNVYEMFNQSAVKFPDREAVIQDGKRISYYQLKNIVEKAAGNLQRLGVKKGERVAMLLGNHIEFIITALACAKIGAVFVPLNTKLTINELSYMIGHSGAVAIITSKKYLPEIGGWVKKSSLRLCLLIDGKEEGWLSFQEEMGRAAVSFGVALTDQMPLYILYTSGTTGLPKGGIGSHINVIHSAISYREVMQSDESTRTLIAIPLFHVTGLIGQLFHMLLVGGAIILLERYSTVPYIQTVAKEKATFLFNVPTIYIMMMDHESFRNHSYEHVKTIAYGGAPISAETVKTIRTHFPHASLHNAYGATETTSPTTVMPREYGMDKIASVGLPVPVAEIKTVKTDGRVCAPDEVGELYIKGPMVVPGYWENDEANKKAFDDDGFWKSGDLARIDPDGFVYIMDRKKDMINRGGEKIYSIEVENALYRHPKVLEASVVGMEDPLFGEYVKAYVVKKPESDVTESELIQFAKEQLADYKVPKEIEFLDELPRNAGGKVLKTRLMGMGSH
ncbi:class I adenylate-forming enzyme family protein [Domibacillus epiphyticus]|uniref:AMP-dependent synthetase n=1 Tax=Domibacillus epiphyticus TaxID=1714355 RepID=A0A1V2A5T8_9BACI|nr:class I adenylate-forming enzyme family protein [Domibacillus epiphyticus]OMP66375.1 AMP-dependent synthetase [Domibacillus epiphyticus]